MYFKKNMFMKGEKIIYMNKMESDVMLVLSEKKYNSQRFLAEETGYSLGLVNRCIKNLIKTGYLDKEMQFTESAKKLFSKRAPRNAVILAAGFGMRMVPINMETPKALLEVRGERLIERLIRQLQDAGVMDIYIVVGYRKESLEYLIDEFGVKLIVNTAYIEKNNLYSLMLASKYISNTYILPADLWCAENPFRRRELYSWYMVGDRLAEESVIRVNRKMELVKTQAGQQGNAMVGISYILEEEAEEIRKRLGKFCQDRRYDNAYWEETLYQNDRMVLCPRLAHSSGIIEINTYEQLRELDSSSNQLRSDAVSAAAKALKTSEDKITEIFVLKKGMTNRSFSFRCGEKRYIMRIPGEGTEYLINRKEEAEVYEKIKEWDICDRILYLDPENGYKITEYIEGARVCNPECESDVRKCIEKLRGFHELDLEVAHEFDLWQQIAFYESLWGETDSCYKDYAVTKARVLSLKSVIEKHVEKKTLTHIDAVPDNFLFSIDENGKEDIRMIDWEYAGMQDPHMDIAMFCIYAFYNKEQVDYLIDLYFKGRCENRIRIKIYCYIAACGLLWSNWCEYKRKIGVDFGEYSLRQYRYAKEYYQIARRELEKTED